MINYATFRELIEEVQELYVRAANIAPLNSIDGDVQCGLGILLNLVGEYDRATDCFQSAIQGKPQVSLLLYCIAVNFIITNNLYL